MGRLNLALATTVAIGLATGADLEADVASTAHHDEDEVRTWQGCQPENTSIGGHLSALEYARMIEPELGVPPVVDCGAGVEQPIYVNG
ncbi:MAG: hypothetical protein OXQ90_18905, partial [Gammaproteobacteria bacterium]|nr:hypothetical protein [Gammaproteobacteria bacterium]